MRRRSLILLIVLGVVFGAIIISYFTLSKDNRSSSVSSDGISFYRSANMEIDSLSFNFVAAKDPEFVNIMYDVRNLKQNTTGLVTIDIPYDGILSVPDNWSANKSSTSDSTLIYRLFQCSNSNPCTKDFSGQVVFTFSKGIDEKDGYHHSIQLNVKQSPFDEGISNEIQNLQKGVGLTLLNDSPYSIAIFLDSSSDKISVLPPSDEQYSTSIFGINTSEFSWNIRNSINRLFTVEYEIPNERQNWSIFDYVLIPIGAAVGIALILDIINSMGFFGSENNSRQERKEHSKFLNEQVYKRLLNIFIRPDGERKLSFKVPVNYEQYQVDKIQHLVVTDDPPLTSVSTLQYFEYAMEHLKHKKYKKIVSHWRKGNDLLNEYNHLMNSLPTTFQIAITREMKSKFPNFVEFRGDGRDNSYLSTNIIDRLCQIHEYGTNIQKIDLNPVNFSGNDNRIMSEGMTIIQSPNLQELDIDRCRQVLIAVYGDQDIQTKFNKLDELRKKIGHEIIEEFSSKLEDVVTKIDGGHFIEGKCELEN